MNHPISSARLLVLLLSGAGMFAGCASTTPQLDATFGEAVRSARTTQTLNPKASENTAPVLGMDGKAAASAQQRYQESFQTPPKTFEIINIGGAITEK